MCVANATFCQLILACLFPSFSLVGVCPNNKVEKRRQQEQEKEDGADAEEVMEKRLLPHLLGLGKMRFSNWE